MTYHSVNIKENIWCSFQTPHSLNGELKKYQFDVNLKKKRLKISEIMIFMRINCNKKSWIEAISSITAHVVGAFKKLICRLYISKVWIKIYKFIFFFNWSDVYSYLSMKIFFSLYKKNKLLFEKLLFVVYFIFQTILCSINLKKIKADE